MSSIDIDNIQSLRSTPINGSSIMDFIRKYPLKTYVKGEMILLKDEVPGAIYMIESGTVKAYDINSDGSEQLVSIHTKTDFFPVSYIFLTIKKSQFFYTALTDCSIRIVPRIDFLNYFESNVTNMRNLCIGLTKRLILTTARIGALGQPRATKKIALSLLHIPDQLGINKRPHKPHLKVSITQQEIADSIGLTRETIGIELNKLRTKKLITYTRSSYVIHMERLRKYLHDNEI